MSFWFECVHAIGVLLCGSALKQIVCCGLIVPAQAWEESQQAALGEQWGLPNDLQEAPEKLLQSSQGPVLRINLRLA